MNVSTLCLAILFDTDASGYEIRKQCTEGEYAYFVEASYGSIYPALSRLEAEKLVTSHVQQQEGRPAKKVYAITNSGRKALLDELFEELDPDIFRSEFLLFARFAPHLPQSLVRQRLEERLEQIDEEIRKLNELGEEYKGGADRWILSYGRACMQVARDHIATHMHELIEIAQPDDTKRAALAN